MQPVTKKRWTIRTADEDAIGLLVREKSLSPYIARVLVNRGITSSESATAYLSPSLSALHEPMLLAGMDRAVERLVAARSNGDPVCVYGDYDVDGITSVALLISFFRAAGISCFYHIPRRLEEGYGLSCDGISFVASHGAKVVVSVDCGTTAVDEARLAATLGIDLIITDHHTPGDALPEAYAVINPQRPDCSFPFKGIAGVGVAFNLLMALRRRLREDGAFKDSPEPDLREYFDLVALGTIADVVSLQDENRTLARFGLKAIETSTRAGIIALKEVSAVAGEVSCSSVGFRLAPRLNAAGRLEDAALGVELLLSDDIHAARRIAAELDAGNSERQAIEKEILRSAVAMIGDSSGMSSRSSIVLASEEWHPGVIGIVASRIVDLYHRPTILIALQEGVGRGSGRSIPGFHLYRALHASADHLVKFGGHRQAAGLSIDESTLSSFVERFDQVAAGELSEDDLVPELLIDAVLAPEDLTLDLAQSLAALYPFGMGNPEPLFLLRDLRVSATKVLKGSHLKLVLEVAGQRIDAVGFGMAGRSVPERLDIAAQLQVNVWNGRTCLQLRLKDFRESG
ncbi:single-stranded-DNA-specific exonuclease RecJ [Geobacter sp. OR-1]|uniref:single-stranded-DNA-specific exonuclease RecJ n=1 Tax=Geobacter sp. OR-1 TaxID=1266765 RepID=UPI0005427FA0|nr:single-stranded-DNA-specific exonuclease RecJ [Geobacter sp. OR-1]GAM08049.1 single-stranded-DNA-specific exonuclease RecJ [Geobacter sp. OR-1]